MSDFTWTPDFPIDEEVGYKTLVSNFENGVEQRRAVRSGSMRKFTLNFQNRIKSEMEAVRDFFVSKKGALTAFTWVNPNDSATYTVRYAEDSFKFSKHSPTAYDFSCEFLQVL